MCQGATANSQQAFALPPQPVAGEVALLVRSMSGVCDASLGSLVQPFIDSFCAPDSRPTLEPSAVFVLS